MATTLTRQRTYAVSPELLTGACLTALGRMRAQVEQHDLAQGTIVAAIGGSGPLAPASELALVIAPAGAGRSRLMVTWRARRLGGDRAILPAFLASVDSLAEKS
jgi:hypothetical protein